jgi:hypothetical protein
MDERKRSLLPWIVAGLVLVPVIYVLSVPPLLWAFNRNLIPRDGSCENALDVYLVPWFAATGNPASGWPVDYQFILLRD